MDSLADMIWIEWRKVIRSRMLLWTAIGSLFMPAGIAFLIYVSKNPEISQKLGLVSAKANLLAYSATDWQVYLGLSGQMIAAGGFFLFVLATSWVFGREFADGTLKDMLAVPVPRASILLAKFCVVAIWSAVLSGVILAANLGLGYALKLPGNSIEALTRGSAAAFATAGLTMVVVMPFALFASLGRGYLLPMGMAVLTIMLANLVVVLGWGEYFPWSIAGLYAQGKSTLPPSSYAVVFLTGLVGVLLTYLWWKLADQSR